MKPKNLTPFVWALSMLFLTIVACTATGKPTAVPSLAPTTSSSPITSVGPSPAAQGVSPADLPSQPLDEAGDVKFLQHGYRQKYFRRRCLCSGIV